MSILTVNTGTMFSGKSTMLINQGEKHAKAGQKVLYIKPALDNRYSESEIVTHDGIKVPALSISGEELFTELEKIKPKDVDVVLIDEAQFFPKNLSTFVWWLLKWDIRVYASGLDMTYLSDGFETMAELMCMADKVNKLKAVCNSCGGESVVTGRKSFFEGKDTGNVVELGESESYIPLCRKCYFNLMEGKE